jgi:hypothetical protein
MVRKVMMMAPPARLLIPGRRIWLCLLPPLAMITSSGAFLLVKMVPQWSPGGVLTDEQIWQVATFVRTLK